MSTTSTESSSGVRYYVGDEAPSALVVHASPAPTAPCST